MIDTIDWNKNPLIPAITQDSTTKQILMCAYMNQKALNLSLDTGYMHYYSRSKQRIWKKGESSNHTQQIQKLYLDCDKDAIVAIIKQKGNACHTGEISCFFNDILENKELKTLDNKESPYDILDELDNIIKDRKHASKDKSYTKLLFDKGDNHILKKVSEECGEFICAIKDNDEKEIIYEASDLIYHIMVAMQSKNISLDRVKNELKRRFSQSGIEEKNGR
jgi:phosphoribosyl-ATP pyrophosphohydrolase/phosphoribosyl-AMP cyclohydrolase